MSDERPFVSRGGLKLDAALREFAIDVSALTAADFGSNTGGFVDCLLRRGVARVYAVDPGYGVLDYALRRDPRVVVMERRNALHAACPEHCDLVTIDVAWTPQRLILPAARRWVSPGGAIVTLVKPHYEAEKSLLRDGILPEERLAVVLGAVRAEIDRDWRIEHEMRSPITGRGGNSEFLWHLRPVS